MIAILSFSSQHVYARGELYVCLMSTRIFGFSSNKVSKLYEDIDCDFDLKLLTILYY